MQFQLGFGEDNGIRTTEIYDHLHMSLLIPHLPRSVTMYHEVKEQLQCTMKSRYNVGMFFTNP